jgi:hypothetical protein
MSEGGNIRDHHPGPWLELRSSLPCACMQGMHALRLPSCDAIH